jgi:hypothetical protein
MSSVTRKFVYDHDLGACVEVERKGAASQLAPASIGPTSVRPLVSNSAGVLPHQVPEARRLVEERRLVGCHVRDDGMVEFTSRGNTGRNGWNRMRCMTDNEGGFGDV